MFLVTTADQRYWKQDEKILFLGEWCKIYDQRHVWSKLDYQVLPYHWDDRHKLYQDYLHLQSVYERYLEQLAARLNEIHQVNHSLRYWRIVIGPWLFYFIQVLYDRYLSLCKAAESLATQTWIANPEVDHWTPVDFSTFVEWCHEDEYNHYLYSCLIKVLGQIPFEVRDQEPLTSNRNSNAASGSILKQVTRKLMRLSSRSVPDRWNQVVFVASYLERPDLLRLQRSLGQLPYLSPPSIVPPDEPVEPALRERLMLKLARDQFESVLDNLIPRQMPKTYLEGYAEVERKSAAAFPRKPKVIFTANAVSDNGFTFWAARNAELGTRLIISQHGGHYGSCLWSTFEEHEINISDRYFTWGWQIAGEPKTMPMSAGKLAKRSLKPDGEGTILWVDLSVPRSSVWLSAGPMGRQMLDYLDDQKRFAAAVSPAVHDLLLLRLYVREHGWNEMSRWKEMDPSLKCYRGAKPMAAQLNESRLMIATCNSTTFLETFAADFPTLMFWNPKHWEIRPAAQPYFDELREVGILHDTPESAADKVNKIYQDPLSWWREPTIQKTRDRFCEQFARTSRDWLSEWKAGLLAEAHAKTPEAIGSLRVPAG